MTKEYIVIAFTENQIGVLNRITALYLRRKINIESLKVSESSIRGISMFVISAFTTRETIDKLVKQLRNIIDVIQVEYYSNEELITQEIALYKITSKIFRESGTVDRIVREWNARIIEMNPQYVVVEKTGTREDIDAMRSELEQQQLLTEFTRSGTVVLHRDSVEDKLQAISDLKPENHGKNEFRRSHRERDHARRIPPEQSARNPQRRNDSRHRIRRAGPRPVAEPEG